ncbi:MAG: hypothetical protein EPO08_09125 [Rhodospirillaceae bacterium]|nr:MAG: hypothetical protein EPO08_09125 [Rhodospirillaceae bacterium]
MSLNTAYFTSLINRANSATSCAQLQAIYTEAVLMVNSVTTAMSNDFASIQTIAADLEAAIVDLANHIATLAASQAAATGLATLPASAAGLATLGSVITFCQAQAALLATHGTAQTATFIQQALALAADYTKISNDYALLQNQVSNLTAQIAAIPALLSSFESAAATAASKFPGCAI